MSISILASYLANGADISLSSPFIVKKVTINAHPSSEAEKEAKEPGIITRSDYYNKPTPYSKLGISSNSLEIYENLELQETPEINYFTQSSMPSSSRVEKYINNGYTPEEAVNMVNARKKYEINESFYKNGVYTISSSYLEA